MANPVYLSRVVLAPNEWGATFNVDGVSNDIYVPAGAYYIDEITTAWEDEAEDVYAGESFTIDFSLTTGKTSIRCSTVAASDFDLTWLSTSFRDWMGFTAGFSNVGTTTQTATNIAQGVLFAGSGRKSYRRKRHNDNRYRRASSGRSAGVGSADVLYDWTWLHEFEPLTAATSPVLASGTLDEAGTVVPWTWEDFFAYHKRTSQPFRLYESSADSLSAYLYGHALELNAESRGPFEPKPTEDDSDRYFTVPMACSKFTGT